MDDFTSSLCWNSANGACATKDNGQAYSSIIDKLYLIYLIFVNCGIFAELINFASGGKYSDRISKFVFREVLWLHGVATFTIMKLVQPHNLRSVANHMGTLLGLTDYITNDAVLVIMKYSLQAVLAFILWDLLIIPPESGKRQLLINCHHMGLFIAMYFWDSNNTDVDLKGQTELDSYLYGYMWSIHSFGFILEYIFPVIGVHVREGERSKLLDNIKYVYSAGTVYWYYQYFNAKSQPGVGLNYQTLSLMVMLCGRLGLNLRTNFLRRVELPGAFVIVLDGTFFRDAYLQRSITISLLMLVTWAIHYCYIKRHLPKPSQFFGPSDNEHLRLFLESEAVIVNEREDDQKGSYIKKTVRAWFESNKIDARKQRQGKKIADNCSKDKVDTLSFAFNYPLHYAVAKDDANLVEQILLSNSINVNEPLLEHHETTPLQFATFFVSKFGFGEKVLLVLLKHGADPYIMRASEASDCIDELINTPLGSSQDFFRRYNEICLEKSPARVVFSDLSFAEKIRLVPL